MLGFIKGFIEKNTWIGLEEFYDSLSQALMTEYNIPPAKAKRRNRKLVSSHLSTPLLPNSQSNLPVKPSIEKGDTQFNIKQPPTSKVYGVKKVQSNVKEIDTITNSRQNMLSYVVIFLLIALISFNVILYVKMWKLDDDTHHDIIG